MLGRWSEIARLQSDFYRDQLRKVLNWLVGAVLLMFLIIMAIFYVVLTEPTQKYYANTSDGIILPMPNTIKVR